MRRCASKRRAFSSAKPTEVPKRRAKSISSGFEPTSGTTLDQEQHAEDLIARNKRHGDERTDPVADDERPRGLMGRGVAQHQGLAGEATRRAITGSPARGAPSAAADSPSA